LIIILTTSATDIGFSEPTKSLDHVQAKVVSGLNFKFRLYDARHNFATRAVEQNVNLVTLAAMLGHNGLKMVMRYPHSSENEKRDAVKLMQKVSEGEKAKAV